MKTQTIGKRKYEILFLVSPEFSQEEVEKELEKIEEFISELGGDIIAKSIKEKQKLAYPINKKEYVHQVVVNFNMTPEKIKELTKKIKFQDDVLRHMITILDESQENEEKKYPQSKPQKEEKRSFDQSNTQQSSMEDKQPQKSEEEKKKELEEIDDRLDEILNE